jgi:hypothetical protein
MTEEQKRLLLEDAAIADAMHDEEMRRRRRLQRHQQQHAIVPDHVWMDMVHRFFAGSVSSDTVASLFSRSAVDIDRMDYNQLLELAERNGGDVKSKGATAAQLARLPISSYTPAKQQQQTTASASGAPKEATIEEIECAICLGTIVAGESIKRLPCLHAFHTQEVDEWLTRNAVCPVCRAPISFL